MRRTRHRRTPPPTAGRPPGPGRWSPYSCHQVSRAACRPVSTTSSAGSPGRRARAREALTMAMRRRSSRMSTRPRRSPRSSTSPLVGHNDEPTTCNSVVFPDPLGPRSTHRSRAPTDHEMSSRRACPSRTTETCSNRTAGPLHGRAALIERTRWPGGSPRDHSVPWSDGTVPPIVRRSSSAGLALVVASPPSPPVDWTRPRPTAIPEPVPATRGSSAGSHGCSSPPGMSRRCPFRRPRPWRWKSTDWCGHATR